MRLSAILCTSANLLIGLGMHQANANSVEPKTSPQLNSPTTNNPAVTGGVAIISSGTLDISGNIADPQPQVVPAQGQIQLQQAGPATITITASGVAGVPGLAGPVVGGGNVVAGVNTAICGPNGCMSIDASGTRQTQNEEYGQKVKITDDPQKGIKIEQTVHKGGSDETKSFEAKDAEELQKKSPEGYKLYQKYLGAQGGPVLNAIPGFVPGAPGAGLPGQLQINGGGALLQLGPGQIPLPGAIPMPGGAQAGGIQVFQAQAIAAAPNNGLPIDAATQLMGVLSKEIETAAKADAWKDASKEDKTAAKKQVEELKKQLGELEKKL